MNALIKKAHIAAFSLAAALILTGCAGGAPEQTGMENAPGPEPVIYMGDPQSDPEYLYDYAQWGALLALASETAPEAKTLILGGDIVNDGGDDREWEAFFASGGDVLAGLAAYPVTGNHVSDAETLRARFGIIPESEYSGEKGLFYSFDAGGIHFLMLDSVIMGTQDSDLSAAAAEWLEGDLAAASARWVIAVMHHPMYSVGDNYKDEQRAETMRANYLPVLEKHGVDAILCGHQHACSRTVPLSVGAPADGGIIQIMGVSGGKSYSLPERETVEFAYSDGPVFTVITADGGKLSFETYDNAGALIDSAAVTR